MNQSVPYRFVTFVLVLTSVFPFAEADQFVDQVAPILELRCLRCHNDDTRKGDFSLQSAATAFADGHVRSDGQARSDRQAPEGAGISHLLRLITPVDGRAKMPKKAPPLAAEEIAIIRAWIEAGAQWPDGLRLEAPSLNRFDGWSYQPIERPPVPALESDWVRTPVDAFVLEALHQQGLTPANEADRRTLIRRLSYDLIGLPPTPTEVEAFVNDPAADAYESLVERLLESKHYGERWARHWLDVVQYADTCGYDKDKLRPNAWPYRDYVIRSLNDDKPYAKFVQEQIAGDVLFPGDPDGIVALGFIAAGPWDFIGHVEVPESKIDGRVARNLDRDDMVSNTFNTFCSLTVQCARCHDHKFDPIRQEHYYALQAIFAAVDRAERPYDLTPEVAEHRRRVETELAQLNRDLRSLDEEIARAAGPRVAELAPRIRELRTQQHVVKEPQFGYHSALATDPAVEKWVAVDLGEVVDIASVVLRPCHDDFAGIGAGFGFPVRFRLEVSDDAESWRTIHDRSERDLPNPGLTAVEVTPLAERGRHLRVRATKLARRANDFMVALAEFEVRDPAGNNLALGAAVTALDSIEAPVRWSRDNLTDGRWARPGDPQLADRLAEAVRERAKILARIETPERAARRATLEASIRRAESERDALPRGRSVYAAATHFEPQGSFQPTRGRPRPIRILRRGDVREPRELSAPALLPLGSVALQSEGEQGSRLAPDSTDAERRAALARWLTDENHPLLWRSIVNRVWQHHFGQGLVRTPNDFGRMGAKPTHPELLDWLACEFRNGGQSLKRLHRLLVTSSVYRQASRFDTANAAIDGENRYLWHMARRRLDAESIRDSILAVSGALHPKMGGPGFYLFELERTEHSPHYEYHKFDPTDPATHRRSIYRFVVRSQPDPWMTTLDCADSSQSTPKRDETLTSLQALALYNSRFTLAMAERFAARLTKEASDLPEQVERGLRLVTQRPPTDAECDDLLDYARAHGLVQLCRVLFNLSEFVYLD